MPRTCPPYLIKHPAASERKLRYSSTTREPFSLLLVVSFEPNQHPEAIKLKFKTAPLISLALPFALLAEQDWPQWRGPERDGVWRESGLSAKLKKNEQGWIDLKWSVNIAAGYSQPTVADNRVYVTDRLDDPDEIERVLRRATSVTTRS